MLTRSDLDHLARTLRDETVLSVYIDGTASDPAKKRPWRISLDNALKDIRTWLRNSSHAEREDFERAVALLTPELGADDRVIGSPGWAAFVTPERVWYASAVRSPFPTLAIWSTGICISPYLRALKQERPVILAVADAKQADVYRYAGGVLSRVEHARSETHAEPPAHMGDAPRAGFHPGVQGMTGRDAMQRDRLAATAKMLRDVAADLTTLAGRDGAVLIAGTTAVAQQLWRELPSDVASRAGVIDDVDVQMSEAELRPIVEREISALRDGHDRARIERVVDLSGQGDRGALGELDTLRALDQRQVAELYLTPRFLERDMAGGEAAVRKALDQGADVEEVSGPAAELLDGLGGIAARLRFVVPMPAEQELAASDMTMPA